MESTGDAGHTATNAICMFKKVGTLRIRMFLLKELIDSEGSTCITALTTLNDRIDFIVCDEAANGRNFNHL